MGYAAYELEERQRQGQAESLEEYAELKDQLLKRTQRAGAFLAGYLFLTVSGTVGNQFVSHLLTSLLICSARAESQPWSLYQFTLKLQRQTHAQDLCMAL